MNDGHDVLFVFQIAQIYIEKVDRANPSLRAVVARDGRRGPPVETAKSSISLIGRLVLINCPKQLFAIAIALVFAII